MNVRLYGCLTFIFYQRYFYDEMDCNIFYFHVTNESFIKKSLNSDINKSIIMCTTEYTVSTKRFSSSLIQ